MEFREVANTFNQMSETSSRLGLATILADLFSKSGDDLKLLSYLVQGKLAPDYENRETYLAEKLIMKVLSQITGITEAELTKMQAREGDLGTLGEEVLKEKKQRSLVSEMLTVKGLHERLMNISAMSGAGSETRRLANFKDILLNASPDEAKYVIRIVTGRLRLGVSDATILSSLAEAFDAKDIQQDIENAFNFHPDMGMVAELLQKKKFDDLKKISAEPLIPFRVMLAERLQSVDEILEKMGGTASFEYKYDGLRVQIHRKGETLELFSRRSERITRQFPDIVENAKKAFSSDSFILDGEAVPINLETGELYPFQVVSQRRGRINDLERMMEEIPIVVFLFDVIYYDGKFYGNEPYGKRRKKLESLVKKENGFRLASNIVSSDADEIMKFFDQSISEGCEGIVAKNVTEDSIYRAGARGWLWIKFKRDYQAELADTVDLVIVGAFHGRGRRKGTYGALLMAVYNRDLDRYETVCKLGTGFTDEMLLKIHSMLEEYISEEQPSSVESKMRPDVWIYPSTVLEVAGAEITLSPIHTCSFNSYGDDVGLSIRFPRFTGRFRDDRGPDQATNAFEIKELYERQKKKQDR